MANHPNREKKVTVRDAAIKRWFGDMQVVEAKRDLHIQPSELDIKNATPGDPCDCVFSQACKRMYGSTVVLFFGSVAYVDLLSEDGVRRVHRFVILGKTRKLINDFDEGKTVLPSGFTLRAPTPSATLDAVQKRGAQRYVDIKAGVRPRLLAGRKESERREQAKPKMARVSFFRHGAGRVHFA